MKKRFTVIDEKFVCDVCHKDVDKLNYTSRDHCPFCLSSKHVDIFPGDRKEECKGTLKPVAVEKHKNTYKIVYKCLKCGKIRKNIMANDDNFDLIIQIMSEANSY